MKISNEKMRPRSSVRLWQNLFRVRWIEQSGPVIYRQNFDQIFSELVNDPIIPEDDFADGSIAKLGDYTN